MGSKGTVRKEEKALKEMRVTVSLMGWPVCKTVYKSFETKEALAVVRAL